MKTTISAIGEFDRHIEALCQTHQDYQLFAALPGVGTVYAARLTAALGSDRSRWTTADELLRFSGIAPVMERGTTSALSSSANRFTNMPANRLSILSGPELITLRSEPKGRIITPQCEPWPSNGSGSSGSAGRRALPTVRSSTWKVCERRDRLYFCSQLTTQPRIKNFLTCRPQLSC